MKPLVLWCRWHDARLRLHGRSESAVWGELALPSGTSPFRFELKTRRLTIGEGSEAKAILLDDMGVELNDKGI